MAKVKKEAEEAMVRYMASEDFGTKKAWVVSIFHELEELFTNYRAFSQEAFKKGYDLGKLECRTESIHGPSSMIRYCLYVRGGRI